MAPRINRDLVGHSEFRTFSMRRAVASSIRRQMVTSLFMDDHSMNGALPTVFPTGCHDALLH